MCKFNTLNSPLPGIYQWLFMKPKYSKFCQSAHFKNELCRFLVSNYVYIDMEKIYIYINIYFSLMILYHFWNKIWLSHSVLLSKVLGYYISDWLQVMHWEKKKGTSINRIIIPSLSGNMSSLSKICCYMTF